MAWLGPCLRKTNLAAEFRIVTRERIEGEEGFCLFFTTDKALTQIKQKGKDSLNQSRRKQQLLMLLET